MWARRAGSGLFDPWLPEIEEWVERSFGRNEYQGRRLTSQDMIPTPTRRTTERSYAPEPHYDTFVSVPIYCGTNMSYPLFHPSCPRAPELELSAERFAEEFPAESERIEFKEGVPLDRITKTSAAFSNTDGGVILLGVSDTGQIRGLSLSSDKEVEIHNRLATVTGLGEYRIHRLEAAGRDLVAIGVDRQRDGFAQLSNGQVKERRGASNHTPMGVQLADFIARRFVRAPEATATEAATDQIDADLALQLASAWEWNIGGDQDLLMQRLRDNVFLLATGHDERLSVAGVLYLVTDPGTVLGKAYVEVFRYRDDGLNYDRRAEFRGPLQQQVDRSAEFVLDELGYDMATVGVHRHELHRLPYPALREAIANAVAHRSYAATGEAVRIEIRPDRVVVRSPGALPGGVTLADIAERSVPRNILVIRTLRFFGVAEDAGQGVDLMQRHMALNFMPPPHFAADDSSVTVTLRLGSSAAPAERALLGQMLAGSDQVRARPYSVGERESTDPGTSLQDATLLLHAVRGRTLTNARARELLEVGVKESRAALHRLRDRGLLEQHGTDSGTLYSLHTRFAGPDGVRTRPRDFVAEVLAMASKGPITNASVRTRTGLDRAMAVRILNRLVADGQLERRGSKRGTHYVLRR